MNLYLDAEWNGHGSDQLISLAIASPDGKHWYGICDTPVVMTQIFGGGDIAIDPWVRKHVMPQLYAYPWRRGLVAASSPTVDYFDGAKVFRASLHEYLLTRSGSIIYADFPDDFAHLMRIMSGPSYEDHWIVDIGMQLLAESDPRPEVPHNALSDAIALMHWHVASGGAA